MVICPHLYIFHLEADQEGDHGPGLFVIRWHGTQEVGVRCLVTQFNTRSSIAVTYSRLSRVRPQLCVAYYHNKILFKKAGITHLI